MKKLVVLLLALTLVLGLFTGCGGSTDLPGSGIDQPAQTILPVEEPDTAETVQLPAEEAEESSTSETASVQDEPASVDEDLLLEDEPDPLQEPEELTEEFTEEFTEEVPGELPGANTVEETPEEPAVTEDGSYTTPEDVALYIHTYGHLPANFITKNEARDLGWVSSQGNLWDVAPGMSIGGDRFGNYEGLLPEGSYRECDVNYAGGFRGGERLIYGSDGSIWYTNDHYESFTQLY